MVEMEALSPGCSEMGTTTCWSHEWKSEVTPKDRIWLPISKRVDHRSQSANNTLLLQWLRSREAQGLAHILGHNPLGTSLPSPSPHRRPSPGGTSGFLGGTELL